MKKSTKVDGTVFLGGIVMLAFGFVAKDEVARDFGLVLLAKALPRPSEYGRLTREAKAFIRKGRA